MSANETRAICESVYVQIRIVECLRQRIGERHYFGRINEQAGLIVLYQFRDAAGPRRNDGDAGSECLDNHNAARLAPDGRYGNDSRTLVEPRQLRMRYCTTEPYISTEIQMFNAILALVDIRAVFSAARFRSDDMEFDFRPVLGEYTNRLDQFHDALFGCNTSDEEDIDLLSAIPVGLEKL